MKESQINLAIVLWNRSMFAATGETDKPVIVLELTKEQTGLIQKQIADGLTPLSFHIINEP